MADTDGRAELRGRIDELKLELIRFVLFEVRQGEAAGGADQLAEPVRAAISDAVKEAVAADFAEGSKKIADTADALNKASADVTKQVEAVHTQLAGLIAKIEAADKQANELRRELATFVAQSSGQSGGARSVQDRMSAYKGAPAREPVMASASGAADPQAPSPPLAVPVVDLYKGPPDDKASGGLSQWLKKYWLWVLGGALVAVAVVAIVVVTLNRTFGTAVEQAPANHSPLDASALKRAATALRSVLVEDNLLSQSAERWSGVGSALQHTEDALADLQSAIQSRGLPAEAPYFAQLGALRQSVAQRQAALGAVPQANRRDQTAEIGRLRALARDLEAAANQSPVPR